MEFSIFSLYLYQVCRWSKLGAPTARHKRSRWKPSWAPAQRGHDPSMKKTDLMDRCGWITLWLCQNSYGMKMAIELVDFPWKIVIFYSHVKLPEGMIFNDEICVTTIAFLRITFFRIRKDCGWLLRIRDNWWSLRTINDEQLFLQRIVYGC